MRNESLERLHTIGESDVAEFFAETLSLLDGSAEDKHLVDHSHALQQVRNEALTHLTCDDPQLEGIAVPSVDTSAEVIAEGYAAEE